MSSEFTITKCGSFCFWGDWFGRPLDNSHKCVRADYRNGLLTADFADGESLTVYGAKGVFSDDGRFYVTDADTIVWEWELYSEPKSEDSRRFIEYKKQSDGMVKKTTDLGSNSPEYIDPTGKRAVELY